MKKLTVIILFLFGSTLMAFAQVKKPAAKPNVKNAVHKNTHVKHPVTNVPAPQKEQRVELVTDYGMMILKLYNETPKHRDNFIKLVKQGFYDSLLFHRVISSFMIQGGDPNSKNSDTSEMLGSGDVGYKIPAEIMPSLYHKKGALAAARDNNPEKASSGCQFYIVQGKKYTIKELELMINNVNMGRKQKVLYDLYQRDSVQLAVNIMQNAGDKDGLRKYIELLQPAADKEFNEKYPKASEVDMDHIEMYQKLGGAPQLDGDYTVFGEVESGWEVIDRIAKVQTRASDNRPLQNIKMKMRLL